MPDPVIFHREETVSTMDDAREAVGNGAGHWTVCTAGHQSAGRGRMPGRQWEDSGTSLLFTLILECRRVRCSYPVTQLLALALCRFLEESCHLSPGIKWPNDVLLDGRKLAGILVETEKSYFLAGIGLNISQSEFPQNLRRPAVSLAMALAEKADGALVFPESVTPEACLAPLLDQINRALTSPPDVSEIFSRLENRNSPVTVSLGDPSRNEELTGFVDGLQNDGALLIRGSDGEIIPVYSGEMG